MNILGLHFGHDAAATVLRNGRVASYVMRERHSRVKHAISLEIETIDTAIEAAGLRLQDIDSCAITSTQGVELVIDDPARFSISFTPHAGHTAVSTMPQQMQRDGVHISQLLGGNLLKVLYHPQAKGRYLNLHYGRFLPEYKSRTEADFHWFGWMDTYLKPAIWTGATLNQIAGVDFSSLLQTDTFRLGMHYPVTVQLHGRELPGYFVHHHMAHSGSVFYQSGFAEAAICSADGYHSEYRGPDACVTLAGLLSYGIGNKIYPLLPHMLNLGVLYESVGYSLGLGDIGPAGKLMGLAPYGKPRFFDPAFVGNYVDWQNAGLGVRQWIQHCIRNAQLMNYDVADFGDESRVMAPVNVDIAASTQKLFEESYLAAVEVFYKVLERTGRRTPNLCLSGGTALNCPSNSRIFQEGRFPNVFIEPGCDDSGLAIGAALFLHHNVLDQPLVPRTPGTYASPYLGVQIKPQDILAALQAAGDKVLFTQLDDPAASAADDLVADRIIGWFEGRSEIGPRALGHRSILADARQADNWPRVNKLKAREPWRPFAPAVLESETHKWFSGTPIPSPYMLFNATVRSTAIPAVTHVDGSARIQTVDPSCGNFFRLITRFFEKTGVPVVLNTSFNGPGEPIVESPQDAIQFLIQSTLDVLYLENWRVTRKQAPE